MSSSPKSLPLKRWTVIEVENGYVILEDNPGYDHMEGRKWVADNVQAMMNVIGMLANGEEV